MNQVGDPPTGVEQAFVVASALQGVRQYRPSSRISFAHLMCYLEGAESVNRDEIELALGSHLPLRRMFNDLLAKRAVATLAREARADDGSAIQTRQGEGFSVLFRESKASPDQVFVILKLATDHTVPHGRELLLVAQCDEATISLKFPVPDDDRSQLILLDTDDRLHLLRNPDSALYLVPCS